MTPGMPIRRLLLVVFFAYVVLDLGCPMVPGAFSFDPAESVDAVGAYRVRPAALPRIATVPASAMSIRPLAETVAPSPDSRAVPSLVVWRPHAGRDRAVGSGPRPSTEDD